MTVKGVCLAAGLGTRLQPLTNDRPKAAIPILGVPSLYFSLMQLQVAEISEVAVNAFHKIHVIQRLVDRCPLDLDLFLSIETELLGSGGAYPALAGWRDGSDLVVYNSDIISHLNLAEFYENHQKQGALVSVMVLKPPPGIAGGVVVEGSKIVGIGTATVGREGEQWHGGGAFVLSNRFLSDYLPKSGVFSLIPSIKKALEANEIVGAFHYHGYWRDLGNSPSELLNCHLDLLADPKLRERCHFEDLWRICELSFDQDLIANGKLCDQKIRGKQFLNITGPCALTGPLTFTTPISIDAVVVAANEPLVINRSRMSHQIQLDHCDVQV